MMDYQYLNQINDPADLRKVPVANLQRVADETRQYLVHTLSDIGGHLGSNLGVVELTVALHYSFNTPTDKIVWDTGHQGYIHKILTGRRDLMHTIRQTSGLAPFLKRCENEYDVFGAGHASTSISAGLGIAKAFQMRGLTDRVVAVIGDGAMTSGLAFEALNNAGNNAGNLIVILNDNKMGIDPNVGAMCKFFTSFLNTKPFFKMRELIKRTLKQVPAIGDQLFRLCQKGAEVTAGFFTPGFMFESFGFHYIGPLDGHDVEEMVQIFKAVRENPITDKPILIHVLTTKGKGMKVAEDDPVKYHGPGPYDKITGEMLPKKKVLNFSQVAADALVDLAKMDKNVVGITAAMPSGTGLNKLMKEVPEQYFDVGIAEGHAVTFAAGLAAQGYKPFCAVYSTFLQRGYDNILHDVCIQNLPVVFAMDRAGIVGADGPTHHGLFDLSFLRHMPNMVVMVPRDENETRRMFYTAYKLNQPSSIRYPRGDAIGVPIDECWTEIPLGKAEVMIDDSRAEVAILAVGTCVHPAIEAAKRLEEEGVRATVVDMRFVKPLDEALLADLTKRVKYIVTAEENVIAGGFGSAVSEWLVANEIYTMPLKMIGVNDHFVDHGSQEILRAREGLDADGIFATTLSFVRGKNDDVSTANRLNKSLGAVHASETSNS